MSGYRRDHGDTTFELFAKLWEPDAEQSAQIPQLKHINSAHTALDVADERLTPPQSLGYIDLGPPALDAFLAEQIPKDIVLGTVDRFGHDRDLRKRPSKLYLAFRYLKIRYWRIMKSMQIRLARRTRSSSYMHQPYRCQTFRSLISAEGS